VTVFELDAGAARRFGSGGKPSADAVEDGQTGN
jgi:hypothetical protein